MTSPSAVWPYVWMLLGSLAFAFMAAFTHALADSCDWVVVAIVRTTLCLIIIGGYAMAAGVRFVLFRPGILWMRSIAGSISLVCTFYALPRLPLPEVLTLTNVFPVWVAVLSWPMLGEIPPLRVWIAVAAAILGLFLIQQPHFAEGNFASLVALFASLSTAVAMIGLHRLHQLDSRAVVVHFSAVGLVICLITYAVHEPRPTAYPSFTAETLLMLLAVGVAAAVGQLLLTWAFTAGTPVKVSVVGLTQVVFGMLIDVLVWDRQFDRMTVAGIVLVLGPTAWLMARRGPVEEEPEGPDM